MNSDENFVYLKNIDLFCCYQNRIKKTFKMAIVKPFKGLRSPREIVEELSCLPYDVMNSEEAAQMAAGKDKSLLRITKAEIECPGVEDIHSDIV